MNLHDCDVKIEEKNMITDTHIRCYTINVLLSSKVQLLSKISLICYLGLSRNISKGNLGLLSYCVCTI